MTRVPGDDREDDAPDLMLLHGLVATGDAWLPNVEALSTRFRVLRPDLPGYGATPGPFTLDRAVALLADTVAGRTVHLCGLSMGSIVALRFAARYPEQVDSLILSGIQVRPPRLFMAFQRALMGCIPAKSYSSEGPGITKGAVLRALGELSRADLRADLARVRARTLVLCGARDRPNMAAARLAAAGIAGAEFRVVPGAGHEWNGELPEVFANTVIDWALAPPPN